MKKRILSMLVLLAAVVTGAWALPATPNSIVINGTPQVGDKSISLTYHFNPNNVSGISSYAPTLKVKCAADNKWDEMTLSLGDVSSGTTSISLNNLGEFEAGKTYDVCFAYYNGTWVDDVFQSFVPAGPPTYAITLAEGTEDAENWNVPAEAEAGSPVNVTYNGTKRVKSVKAVMEAAAAKTLAEATSEDIGKIAGKDGKIYATKADAEAANTTAVAIIAYVGSATGEASPYTHGLAIAMKDAAAGGSVKWSSSRNDESLTNYTEDGPAVTTAQSGLSNSQTSGFDDVSNYPAFYAALHNTITVSDGISAAAPASGTSGWFLPSLYQWNMIVKGLSGLSADLSYVDNNDLTVSSLNTKIEAAGGTGLQSDRYWSSTEYDINSALGFGVSFGGVWYYFKDTNRYVRSAIAF